MKKVLVLLLITFLMLSKESFAERLNFSIKDALESDLAKQSLSDEIRFSFGKKEVPGTEIGTWISNKKTNKVGKGREESCQRAFISALISLQERAVSEGGSKVVKIHSFYKKSPFWSEDEFQCEVGHIMGGVALRGIISK